MLAGLSFQVISLFIFASMSAEYAFRLYKNPMAWDTKHATLYNSTLFVSYICGLAVATLTLFIRSTFRVAELSGGFDGSLANNQVSFMILEGAMVTIAAGCLTFLHPGLVYKDSWSAANFHFRKSKGKSEKTGSVEVVSDDNAVTALPETEMKDSNAAETV